MNSNEPIRNLYCTCCGARHRGRQWHNMDTGYGLCAACYVWIKSRNRQEETQEWLERTYGIAGLHHSIQEATE